MYEVIDKTKDELKNILVSPVKGYLKENGFLGLVSYDFKTDSLFIASKSTNTGEYKEYFKTILLKTLGNKADEFKELLKTLNSTAVFECIDIENDPHIIEYDESKVILLDVIENSFDFRYMSYNDLLKLANKFNLEAKKLVFQGSVDEMFEFIDSQKSERIEGFVFRDSNKFMFKYKTPFYKFWKTCRGIKDRVMKDLPMRNELSVRETVVKDFLTSKDKNYLTSCSIIDIRKEMEKENLIQGEI